MRGPVWRTEEEDVLVGEVAGVRRPEGHQAARRPCGRGGAPESHTEGGRRGDPGDRTGAGMAQRQTASTRRSQSEDGNGSLPANSPGPVHPFGSDVEGLGTEHRIAVSGLARSLKIRKGREIFFTRLHFQPADDPPCGRDSGLLPTREGHQERARRPRERTEADDGAEAAEALVEDKPDVGRHAP